MRYLSADVGGTFTDLVLIDGATGTVRLDKVPSTPGSAEAVGRGIARLTAAAGLGAADIGLFVHGFTIATNALLTRTGARIALIVTEGFRDVLEIGPQMRPKLYALTQTKPPPVVPRSRVVEVAERIDAFGAVVVPLAIDEAVRAAEAVAAMNPEAVAVCLAFAHLATDHERMIEAALHRRLPGVPVYLSCRVNPQIEEYPRANTTAIAAYVGPVVDRYVGALEATLGRIGVAAPLRLMRSDGGVATPRAARENPAHMLLSGPAGGVIAGAHLAKSIGVADLVTFDMGGTSADFSIIAGGVPRIVGGRVIDHEPLRLPTLDIETISAGGGSIARIDVGGALRVGPDSAGAVPGPACYGQGGTEPTVTDAAVVLGILSPEDYLGGELPLDPARARDAVARTIAAPLGLAVEAAAFGVLTVACAGMNQAIRALSVERGHDARAFSLLAFGGAGPMCASFMARDLGMTEVLVPTSPGVFAALGILLTDIRHTAQAPFHRPFAAIAERDLGDRLTALRDELDAALARDGVAPAGRAFRFATDARCVGQFHELTIPVPAPGAPGWWRADRLAAEFHAAHERAYGHTDARVPVEFVNLRLEGLGRIPAPALPEQGEEKPGTPAPAATRPVTLDRARGFAPTPIYPRKSLRPGDRIAGPAIITQRDSTTVVLPGQTARVERHGIVRIAVGRSGGHP